MPISRTPKKRPLPLPAPPDRRRFRQRLLTWYRRHGRDLPWRKTSDPYHILVSEIMLQQTQVDRVLPKYHEWLEKYPSLGALAAAPEQEVTDTWYPLGYNIRPRRLQTIARESVSRYGGAAAGRRGDAAVVQRDRGVHGGRHSQLRVPRARRHSRYERRPRAVSGLRRRRRSEEPRDETPPVEAVRKRSCPRATSSISIRR